MAGYRFFGRADAAQDQIYRDTAEKWGEDQAEAYIRGLHMYLQKLASNRMLWRRLPRKLTVPPELARDAYFSRYEHHFVFFRLLDDGAIGVMSILHERMNIPVRLREDLLALSNKG
ncbi:type II toxin-antitoxin system RelE/ParE family toxin [Oryzibacter oryziterrae]|uniref:type II toxin-antitoxin system RelE/ParE family toxin n=1 Tax=Oryzibacter oryziterrae TaxID=2766474 RepID=UPI001F37F4D1|nr:type II toxin-antitoxin system RelE/ParE family toxin [Oryzibacter oryziterrae]